jgi:energy-converting hydrogenase Eha subunit F
MINNSTNINKVNSYLSPKCVDLVKKGNYEVTVDFVDIGGIVDHHYLYFLFVISWIFIVLAHWSNSLG